MLAVFAGYPNDLIRGLATVQQLVRCGYRGMVEGVSESAGSGQRGVEGEEVLHRRLGVIVHRGRTQLRVHAVQNFKKEGKKRRKIKCIVWMDTNLFQLCKSSNTKLSAQDLRYIIHLVMKSSIPQTPNQGLSNRSFLQGHNSSFSCNIMILQDFLKSVACFKFTKKHKVNVINVFSRICSKYRVGNNMEEDDQDVPETGYSHYLSKFC